MADDEKVNMAEEGDKPKIQYSGLPANSHKAKEKKNPGPKDVKKVITGEVVERKKPLSKRIAETFTGEDTKSVGGYILFDVIIPAAKTMISDAVSQGIERLLFGDGYSSRRRSSQGYTPYNRVHGSVQTAGRGDGRPSISQRGRAAHDFKEIVLSTRSEAEEVLDRLSDLIESYDVALVSDLYDLVGITGSFTDDKWGWTSLAGAHVSPVRGGYLLNLPRTQAID